MSHPTPSQTVGPFFGIGMPFEGGAEAADPADPAAIRIEGQVLDGAGEPVTGAILEAWEGGQFARCATDPEGHYHFLLRSPAARAGAAAHFELNIFGRGLLRHLATRIYFAGEPSNDGDPVLQRVEEARRATLIADRQGPSHRFDIRLQGEGETVFFEL